MFNDLYYIFIILKKFKSLNFFLLAFVFNYLLISVTMGHKKTSGPSDMLALVLLGDSTVSNFRFLTIMSEYVTLLYTDISVLFVTSYHTKNTVSATTATAAMTARTLRRRTATSLPRSPCTATETQHVRPPHPASRTSRPLLLFTTHSPTDRRLACVCHVRPLVNCCRDDDSGYRRKFFKKYLFIPPPPRTCIE